MLKIENSNHWEHGANRIAKQMAAYLIDCIRPFWSSISMLKSQVLLPSTIHISSLKRQIQTKQQLGLVKCLTKQEAQKGKATT